MPGAAEKIVQTGLTGRFLRSGGIAPAKKVLAMPEGTGLARAPLQGQEAEILDISGEHRGHNVKNKNKTIKTFTK